MKLIYIAGLEHSGTTVTSQLLSQNPGFLALGEIGQFFSPAHMAQYMAKWGTYSDVNICSCGSTWNDCDFWAGINYLNGLLSDRPPVEKYRILLEYVREKCGDETIVLDSSKSLNYLKTLIQVLDESGFSRDDLFIIFSIKDSRNFVKSLVSKQDTDRSLISIIRTFNLWSGSNRQFLEFFDNAELTFYLSLYELLCDKPSGLMSTVSSWSGRKVGSNSSIDHNLSHIAMGNKNFIMRNRDRLMYDSRWCDDKFVNLVYRFHYSNRHFNEGIYGKCSSEAPNTIIQRLTKHPVVT